MQNGDLLWTPTRDVELSTRVSGRKLQQISVYFTAYLAICLLWELVWAGQVRFRLGQLILPHNGIIYLCLCQARRQAGQEVKEDGRGGSIQSGLCRGYCYVTLHYVALPCVALSYVLCPFATCMLTRRLSDMMKIMEQKMSLGMAKTCVSACVCVIYIWAESPLTTASQCHSAPPTCAWSERQVVVGLKWFTKVGIPTRSLALSH